ncbi:MAG: protein kinase, partial [Myxococcota bacterium]
GKNCQQHFSQFGVPPLPTLLQIFEQLLGALEVAHQQHVIHRDLKPENLMLVEGVGTRRTLKILDFGVAKLYTEQDTQAQNLTDHGSAVGTPRYMSPEQACGAIDQIDHRSDLYAVGVMLFEFLTGQPLFDGNSNDILVQHLELPPPTLQEVAPHIHFPPELEIVVHRALAKRKEHRFPSAQAFSDALLPILLEETGFDGHTSIPLALSAVEHRMTPSQAKLQVIQPSSVTHISSVQSSAKHITSFHAQQNAAPALHYTGSVEHCPAPSYSHIPQAPVLAAPKYSAQSYASPCPVSAQSRCANHSRHSQLFPKPTRSLTPPKPPIEHTPPTAHTRSSIFYVQNAPPQTNWFWASLGLFGGLTTTLLLFLWLTHPQPPSSGGSQTPTQNFTRTQDYTIDTSFTRPQLIHATPRHPSISTEHIQHNADPSKRILSLISSSKPTKLKRKAKERKSHKRIRKDHIRNAYSNSFQEATTP